MGLIIPTLVSLPAMALMARLLGAERLGLFMLAFALLGYAGIFDMGITRAVIRSVAIYTKQKNKIREIIGTALWTVLVMSLIVCALIYFGAAFVVGWLNVSAEVTNDAELAFRMSSFIVIPSFLSMILFAYLEGTQQFAKLNVYKTITGSVIGALPAGFILTEATLENALIGFLLARIIALVLAYLACIKDLGFKFFDFKYIFLKEFFSFGGWIALSNVISPIMVYFDRFILSNINGAANVVFYTAPAEAVARISIIPGALARTLFPLFSNNKRKSEENANKAYKGLFFANLCIALPVLFFAERILDLWLGEPYGEKSGNIFRILIIGFVFNSLAQIPFSRIQAYGKARITTFIHLAEILPYLLALTLLVYAWGVFGAAIAWSMRVICDFVLLEYFSKRLRD